MKWMYNDSIVEEEDLAISIKDHGFLYGVGLFETFRTYDGVPFLFIEHIERLQTGLNLIGIKHIIDLEKMKNQLKRLLAINNIKNGYLRLTITAGEESLGLPTKEYDNPSILWQLKPLNPLNDIALTKRAVLLKLRRNLPETGIRLKSLNFLNNVLARQEIISLENTEGIFLTNDGYLAEGIVSNLFFISDRKLYTPSLETGILNGITRQFILQLSQKSGIEFHEGLYTPDNLLKAEEIFITNSIQEIVKINLYNNKELSLIDNSITDYLVKEYKTSIKDAIANKGCDLN